MAFASSKILENLVERVAHLHQIPSRFGEGRNAEHHRFLRDVDESVRIDRHVIGRDDEAILRGLERRKFVKRIQPDTSRFSASALARL